MSEHVLVIDLEEDWHVEHPPTCRMTRAYRDDRRLIVLVHDCREAWELDYAGLDSLDVELVDLAPGRYAIEAWHHTYAGGPWGPAEYDSGLTLLGPVGDER